MRSNSRCPDICIYKRYTHRLLCVHIDMAVCKDCCSSITLFSSVAYAGWFSRINSDTLLETWQCSYTSKLAMIYCLHIIVQIYLSKACHDTVGTANANRYHAQIQDTCIYFHNSISSKNKLSTLETSNKAVNYMYMTCNITCATTYDM